MKIEMILDSLPKGTTAADRETIQRAYGVAERAHAGQTRSSGDPYIHHCLAVAKILADMNLDPAVIAAGLLHDVVEDSLVTVNDLQKQFGPEVARLVDGVTKLAQIDQLAAAERRDDQESESLRKMFLAMVDDVRVVLIKLGDRLHNMRTLGSLPEDRRKRIARETLEIFAPLANRLGIWQMKWELEDLGFRYLEPARYKEIARQLAERRAEREAWLTQAVDRLQHELARQGIKAEVSGRPKHIYSIYTKMERKGISFDQLYDVRAVRVIVDSLQTCYQVLGIVHGVWKPVPNQFDDYIAAPKDNMYRSLHTAVYADDGKTLEIQIRTREMHEEAEYGIAAHWRYKEGGRRDESYEKKVAWLRGLITEWKRDAVDAREFVDSLKADVFQDRVYAFTPKGRVIDLAAGSTPIDFAYHVHTEIGDRCRGARVNGRLVPLDYQLNNGDQVEILVAKRGGPSRDWLNPQLGYVKTQRARNKIKQWFRRQNRDKNIVDGRAVLDAEFKRLALEAVNHERFARSFGYSKLDDFLAAIGVGDVSTSQIAEAIARLDQETRGPQVSEEPILPHKILPPRPSSDQVTVRGAGGFLTHFARCCSPLPGDAIIGYITRGHGVTIHRRDCRNILALEGHERVIEVGWGQADATHPVMVVVQAYDRGGLLHDVSGVVSGEKISLSNVAVSVSANIATLTLVMDVTSVSQLSRVLHKIARIPNVIEARRMTG
jgi:RelA/SpoT family (p)ppGpp synthetase